MREFFRWLARSPIRLVEACSGLLLLTAALMFEQGGAPSVSLYVFGTLLLFLTLYAYLEQGGPDR